MVPDSVVPPSFLPKVPIIRPPLFSGGSLWSRFPPFADHMSDSDSLPSISPRFVAFAWRYRIASVCSLPCATNALRKGRGIWSSGSRRNCRAETTGSPRFLGDLFVHMPRSTTPAKPRRSGQSERLGVAFPFFHTVGLRERYFSGLNDKGLCTRCLRFAVWITPQPRKTRYRVAGLCLPGRDFHPQDPNKRFRQCTRS